MVWYGMVVVDFCALGGRCARRDWHTGKRKGEGEGGKAKILGFGPWSLVLLQDPAARRATADVTCHVRGAQWPGRGESPATRSGWSILMRVFGHLSAALVHRDVFSR